MSRLAILIDGGYVDKVLQDEFGGAKILYDKLAQEVAGLVSSQQNILRVYYYHCLPFKSDPPTREEAERFSSSQNFFDALNRLPRFEVRLGRIYPRGRNADGTMKVEQKMVDVLISVDLVRLATRGQVTDIVIASGDSDFVPAIQVAKDEGVLIWLLHGAKPHSELLNIVDERLRLNAELMKRIKR